MSSKKKTQSGKATKRRPEEIPDDIRLRYEIGGILLGTLGAVVLVALTIGIRGAAGDTIQDAMFATFGLGAWVIPLVVIVAAAYLCFALEPIPWSPKSVAFTCLFIFALAGLHCTTAPGQEFEIDVVMMHGGYVGGAVCVLLRALFGPTGAAIILGGLSLAAISTLLRRPVAHIAQDAYATAGDAADVVRQRVGTYAEERRRQRLARIK
ncbi:MAG: hypothetical protein GF320_08150, partial [Armatimonadia bacterium]|nr:hypothetical protein [Armatimonadia bacterium]